MNNFSQPKYDTNQVQGELTDSLSNSKKTYSEKPFSLDDDGIWVRYKKVIIAGSVAFVLFIILLIATSGGDSKEGGGDTPKKPDDPFEPIVDPFTLTP